MLKYDLQKKGGLSLYEVLYDAMKADILSGRLKPGTRLPSKREMAADNALSVTTVMNAYSLLMLEGYVYSREKKGYYVADVREPAGSSQPSFRLQRHYYREDIWFADFRANNTLYRNFPFSTWKKVLREILSDYEMELVVRGNPYGLEELRAQIAEYLYRVRGISVSPECIVIGAGIEYLYSRLVSLFSKNMFYGVENPVYQKIPQIYTAYGLRWKSIEMDTHGVSIADLRVKNTDIIHVSPEHHYPLGIIMPMVRRRQLLEWAAEAEERYIIEDDFDCEFRYNTRSIPALKSLDAEGKVIYMNTFSKTLSPAVRISYMVLPEKLLERYVRETHFFTNSTSSLEQYALARFMKNGYFERHLNRIKRLYRQEGEQLRQLILDNRDIPFSWVSRGDSGTHLLIRLDTELEDEEIRSRAAAKGIHIGFVSDFCTKADSRYDHILILNFSDLDFQTQREAIDRIGRIFTEKS